MKNIGNIITLAVVIVIVGFAYTWWEGEKNLKAIEFRDYRKEFKAEIDSLKTDVRFIKADTDSLKKGQHIIYREVKKTTKSKSFINELIDFKL